MARHKDWEAELAMQLKAAGIGFKRQYQPILGRKFAFDFICSHWLGDDVLIEVQGGIWMKKGGHNTGAGISRDCEKLSLAATAGYRVICVTPEQIRKGLALHWIEQALAC